MEAAGENSRKVEFDLVSRANLNLLMLRNLLLLHLGYIYIVSDHIMVITFLNQIIVCGSNDKPLFHSFNVKAKLRNWKQEEAEQEHNNFSYTTQVTNHGKKTIN
jgi:hypothetical protein